MKKMTRRENDCMIGLNLLLHALQESLGDRQGILDLYQDYYQGPVKSEFCDNPEIQRAAGRIEKYLRAADE